MFINIHVKQYSSFADDYHCRFEIPFHVFSHLLSNSDSFSLFWVVFKLYLRQFNYCSIGTYRATKISRNADFSVFRVYFISRASEFYSATY